MRFFLFRPRRTAGGALSVLCLALAACSPSHNWRLSRLDGVPVQALMPCKPERAPDHKLDVPPGNAVLEKDTPGMTNS